VGGPQRVLYGMAGSAIDGGNGDAVFLVLAAVVTLGVLLNLSPPRRQIGPAVAGP
jgi:hypothetical protein